MRIVSNWTAKKFLSNFLSFFIFVSMTTKCCFQVFVIFLRFNIINFMRRSNAGTLINFGSFESGLLVRSACFDQIGNSVLQETCSSKFQLLLFQLPSTYNVVDDIQFWILAVRKIRAWDGMRRSGWPNNSFRILCCDQKNTKKEAESFVLQNIIEVTSFISSWSAWSPKISKKLFIKYWLARVDVFCN